MKAVHFPSQVLVCFWAGVSVPLQLGLPDAVPPQYGALREVSIHTVRARLRLLYHFSDLMYSSWRLLNLSPNNQVTC
jgi:E3 ubiquitin-protein ligase HERC1